MFLKENVFQETSTGIIPEDWNAVKLGQLVTIKYGYRCSIPRASASDKGTKIVSTADITKYGALNLSKIRRISAPRRVIEEYAIDAGDLLFNWRNSQIHVGKTAFLDSKPTEEMIFASFLLRLRCNELIYNQFLHILLNYLKDEGIFHKLSRRAVNQANFNAEELKEVKIPLPPFSEQLLIANVLATATLAIQKIDNIIAKTERLKKGLMQQLLTHGIGHTEYKNTSIGKIPTNWEVSTIDKECSIGTGGTPSRKIAKYFGGKISWVKSTEVDYCVITKTGETLTEEGIQKSNAKVYPAGSLVIALYGQGTTRGKCAILGIDAAINQACAVLQSKWRIHIPYLFYWCQNSYSAIRGQSQGANQANLNMGIIRSLDIPLPAISEQKKITEILSTIDSKLKIEKLEKIKAERIKRGLMGLLLTGKVRIKVD